MICGISAQSKDIIFNIPSDFAFQSKNGTFINGIQYKHSRQILCHEDKIGVGGNGKTNKNVYIYRLKYCDELEFENVWLNDESDDDDDKDKKNIEMDIGKGMLESSMPVAQDVIVIDDSDVECVSSAEEDNHLTEDDESNRAGGRSDNDSNFDFNENAVAEHLEYASEDEAEDVEDHNEDMVADADEMGPPDSPEPEAAVPEMIVPEPDTDNIPSYHGPIEMGPPDSPEPEVTVPELVVPDPDDTFDYTRVQIKQEINVMSMELDRTLVREAGQQVEIANEGNIETVDLLDDSDHDPTNYQTYPNEPKVAAPAQTVDNDVFEQAAKRRKFILHTSFEDDKKSIPSDACDLPIKQDTEAVDLPPENPPLSSHSKEILKTVSKLKIKYSNKSRSTLLGEDLLASRTKRKNDVPTMAPVQIKPSWLKLENEPPKKASFAASPRIVPFKPKIPPFVEVQIKDSVAFQWTASNIICEISRWNVKWLHMELIVPPIYQQSMLKTTTEEFFFAEDYQW